MMEKSLVAQIKLTMLMRKGETQEAAEARLNDLLYEAFKMNFNHQVEYDIESVEEDG
ncbi:hypothetical protein [Pseudoflavonifractor phocaeensis]|uniref:hypothetical protein n=1 Tax=Pseudoflavonifractor phocaeensis TaxID=1870988 RepID=UPI001957BC9C|nr:hypothetical protein [Pseudoflavonifractor phocaeensis]MBM6724249.1 hypothetical protein [Pseudoflavonifractor phocaeensis]